MKTSVLLLALTLSMTACTRTPVGTFSAADGSTAAPSVVNANGNIRDERLLQRQTQIDDSIAQSLERLDAALDPNADPANLDKLVQGDEIDPSLLNDPLLLRREQVEQKFDEKNQALIDDTRTGNLDNVADNRGLNPDELFDRDLNNKAQIDEKLDNKAQEATQDDGTEASEDKDTPSENATNSTSSTENTETLPSI